MRCEVYFLFFFSLFPVLFLDCGGVVSYQSERLDGDEMNVCCLFALAMSFEKKNRL